MNNLSSLLFLSVVAAVYTVGLLDFTLHTTLLVQPVYSANSINNQTSATNINCDASSTCNTSATQFGGIDGGDGNLIDQDITQRNLHCTDSSFCNLNAEQRATIGERENGLIFDFGSDNQNSQSHSSDAQSASENTILQQTEQENSDCTHQRTCQQDDLLSVSIGRSETSDLFIGGNNNTSTSNNRIEKSANNNFVLQDDLQKNQHCQSELSCNNFVNNLLGAGSILSGLISVNFDSNDNTITQNASTLDSAKGNTAKMSRIQENSNCEGFCSNGFSSLQSIAEISVGSIGVSGDNNTIIQETRLKDNVVDNILDQTSVQRNHCEGQLSVCNNFLTVSEFVGGSVGGLIVEDGNNNVDKQHLDQVSSNSENHLPYDQSQINNCVSASCQSSSFHETLVGRPVAEGLTYLILNFFGDNNTSIQSIKQTDSNNRNLVSHAVQQKNDCTSTLSCSNDVFSNALIGSALGQSFFPPPAGRIFNLGANSDLVQNNSAINSYNENDIVQKSNQVNSHCMQTFLCFNTLGMNAQVGFAQNGVILNTGDNNSISDSVISINSNNDNKIEQQADQTNEACSNDAVCANRAFASSSIGSITSADLTNDLLANQQISQTTLINDTNNQNSILQKIDQKNLCREGALCENTGTLTSVIQGESNQIVDQSLNQNNLCLTSSNCINDGHLVGASGSNSQSNTCVQSSDCSNTGTNNKNTCTNDSTCINSGIDTKVISTGDPCNSGADGTTTICSQGRIITVSKDPNLTP